VLPAGTPGPVTATLMFLNQQDQMVTTTNIGEEIWMVVKSTGAGPDNMMLMDCTATRVGGTGDSVPFKVIDNGYRMHIAVSHISCADVPGILRW
jgi:hypothetical protein